MGNGSSTARSNAHTLDWDGNAWFAGNITVGEDNKEVALKEDLETSIANLVNSAPETLDTLGELATAFNENKDIVDALNTAIVNKADKTEIPTTLPNPNALIINGVSYDGSSSITINTTNIFDVTVTVDTNGDCTADKTYTELKTAYDNGNILIANVIIANETGPQGDVIYQLAAVTNEDEDSMPMGNTITFSKDSFSNIEGQRSIIFYSTGLILYNETKSNEFTNLILISPDNSRFKITVDNDGVLSAIKLTE